MRKLLTTALYLAAFNVVAESTQISISQQQIDNLAIKLAPLQASEHIPLLLVPAKAVAPANRELLVSSPQVGLLTQLQVNLGDKVQKGQLLAQINSPELVALQQQFLTALSEQHLSGLEHKRDQKLLQEGVIAERRWQETQAIHISKSAKVDEAKQLLLMAGMSAVEINSLAQSRKMTSQINIRAPINGVVLERLATLGARLDVQTPLYRIADVTELWLEINIPQERLSRVHLGDHVLIEDSTATAKISLLGQSVNQDSQTVVARAVVDSKPEQLRIGQNLNVQISQNASQPGFSVPNTAIAQNAGHDYVFVRTTEGFAVQEITVAGKHGQQALITGALAAGQDIAIQGSVALKAMWLGLGGAE